MIVIAVPLSGISLFGYQVVVFLMLTLVSGEFFWFIQMLRAPTLKPGANDVVTTAHQWETTTFVNYDASRKDASFPYPEEAEGVMEKSANPGKHIEPWRIKAYGGIPGWPMSNDGGRKGYIAYPVFEMRGKTTREERQLARLVRGSMEFIDYDFTWSWIGWVKPEIRDAIYRHTPARGKTAIPVLIGQMPNPNIEIVDPKPSDVNIKLRDAYAEQDRLKDEIREGHKAQARLQKIIGMRGTEKTEKEYE